MHYISSPCFGIRLRSTNFTTLKNNNLCLLHLISWYTGWGTLAAFSPWTGVPTATVTNCHILLYFRIASNDSAKMILTCPKEKESRSGMLSEAVSYLPFAINISLFRNSETFCIMQYEGEMLSFTEQFIQVKSEHSFVIHPPKFSVHEEVYQSIPKRANN